MSPPASSPRDPLLGDPVSASDPGCDLMSASLPLCSSEGTELEAACGLSPLVPFAGSLPASAAWPCLPGPSCFASRGGGRLWPYSLCLLAPGSPDPFLLREWCASHALSYPVHGPASVLMAYPESLRTLTLFVLLSRSHSKCHQFIICSDDFVFRFV